MNLIWTGLEDVDQDIDALKVLWVIEINEAGLPELLSMDGGPGEATPLHLGLPLIEGAELLIVLIEVSEELLQYSLDFSVNPRAIPEFDDQI